MAQPDAPIEPDTDVQADSLPTPGMLFNRASEVTDVNFAQRLITTIAVPYEQPALVPGSDFGRPGEVWREIFCRSAFVGVESAPHRIRVNRGHDRLRTVGKVIGFQNRQDALVATAKIARTPLGDETLELASDGCLSASISYRSARADQEKDRFTRTCRVKRAYMDHLSFVENPAYEGAEVLSVREDLLVVEPPAAASTPLLDAFIADPVLQWAMNRIQQ
jgi:phage head maturation protease